VPAVDMSWLNPCNLHLCREIWRRLSPERRQQVSSVDEGDVVLHFKVASALLKMSKEPKETTGAGGERWDLDHVTWHMTRPRTMQLSLEFCKEDDSLLTILQRARTTYEDLMEIIVVINGDLPRPNDPSARYSTWEALSRDVHTIFLAHVNMTCKKLQAADLHLLIEAMSIHRCEPTLRIWPSKKLVVDLRNHWASLTPTERCKASEVSGGAGWLVRACHMLVGCSMTRECLRNGIVGDGKLASAEYEKLRLDELLGADFFHDTRVLRLRESFAAEAGSFDHVLHSSVKSSRDCKLLEAISEEATYISVAIAELDIEGAETFTWKNVAKVAFTLILARFVQFHEERKAKAICDDVQQRTKDYELLQKALSRKASRHQKRCAKQTKMPQEVPESPPDSAPPPKAPPASLPWGRIVYHVDKTFVHVADETSSESEGRCLRRCRSSFL
jgi:hypothetical protein